MSKFSQLDIKCNKIVISENEWTQSENESSYYFRFWKGKLYRKEVNKYAFGGYTIHYVSHPSRLSIEWIETNFNV